MQFATRILVAGRRAQGQRPESTDLATVATVLQCTRARCVQAVQARLAYSAQREERHVDVICSPARISKTYKLTSCNV